MSVTEEKGPYPKSRSLISGIHSSHFFLRLEQDLVGPGKAQNAFMDAFVASRFPPSAPPPAAPAKASAPASVPSKAKPTAPKRGSASTTAARKKGQSSTQAVDLSKAFGNSGAVYVKGRDEDPADFFRKKPGPSNKQPSAPAAPATTASGPSTDRTSGAAPTPPASHGGHQGSTPSASESVAGTSSPGSSGFVLAPTDEMKALDAEIAELTTEGSSFAASSAGAKERKPRPRTCYCQGKSELKHSLQGLQRYGGIRQLTTTSLFCLLQTAGRVHPLFKQRPICIHCGLLLCSLNLPTPLQPEAPCPSCGKVLLTQTERSTLLSSLVSRREEAERQALIRAERVRAAREEQRRRAGEQAGASRDATESLFPELSGGDAVARQKALEVDYALGRKQRGTSEADTGGLRTGPARTGARVLTIGKKGKVTVGSTTKKKAKKPPASTEPTKEKAAKTEGGEGVAEDETTDAQARLDNQVDDDDDAEEEAAAQEEARRLGIVTDPEEAAISKTGPSSDDRPWFNPYLSFSSGPALSQGGSATDSSGEVFGFAYMPAGVRAGFEPEVDAEDEA